MIALSPAVLVLVPPELVLGVVGDDDVYPVRTAAPRYTVIAHHQTDCY